MIRKYRFGSLWKTTFGEKLLYLALSVTWFLILAPQDSQRVLFIHFLLVTTPGLAVLLEMGLHWKERPPSQQRFWIGLMFVVLFWVLRHFLMFLAVTFGVVLPLFSSVASQTGYLAYFLSLLLVFFLPLSSLHFSLRFRYFLDILIEIAAGNLLLWVLFFPWFSPPSGTSAFLLSNLNLFIFFLNLALLKQEEKRFFILLALGSVFFLLAEYFLGFQGLFAGEERALIPKTFYLAWVIGYLLWHQAAAQSPGKERRFSEENSRIQPLLPIAMVLALIWVLVTFQRMRIGLSAPAFFASLVLAIILLVRLGIRAGEAELRVYWKLFNASRHPSGIVDQQGHLLLENQALSSLTTSIATSRKTPVSIFHLFQHADFRPSLLEYALKQAINLEAEHRGEPFSIDLFPVQSGSRTPYIALLAYSLKEQKQQQAEIQQAYTKLEMVNQELEARVQERTRHLQEAYRRLEKQHRELQALDRLKDEFITLISHEVRTPLNNLSGGMELFLHREQLSASARLTIETLSQELQRLQRFLESVLTLSAIQAGKFHIRLVSVSLPAIIGEVQRSLSVPEERLQIRLSPSLPLVLADEKVLHHVLYNLLDNALKYAPEGVIRIQARKISSKVRLRVQDEGPGIPPEKRTLLFQPFQRLHAEDRQQIYGHGVGLYLSKRMLQNMGSDLFYRPASPRGSVFFFDLRIANENQSAAD